LYAKRRDDIKDQNKTVTMVDVARISGVSQTCVSLVLSGKGKNIPQETKDKVMNACIQSGYRRNRIAASLNKHQGGTGIIGLVADELLGNDFAHEIIAGCQAACGELDKTLMIATVSGTDDGKDITAIQTLLDFHVDCIVYATHFLKEVKLPQILRAMPLCLINCYLADGSVSSVIPDDYKGAYKATETLIQKGHRDILFMSNSLTINDEFIPATVKREKAFLDCAGRYGIEASIKRVSIERNSLVSLTDEIFSSRDLPGAVFTYNDRMALTVMSVAKDMGMRIPDDISIMGYDHQEVISRYITPSLETIALPHFDMGYQAIMHVVKLQEEGIREILLEPLLIEGNSVSRV